MNDSFPLIINNKEINMYIFNKHLEIMNIN